MNILNTAGYEACRVSILRLGWHWQLVAPTTGSKGGCFGGDSGEVLGVGVTGSGRST